jgi:hypothetical protein
MLFDQEQQFTPSASQTLIRCDSGEESTRKNEGGICSSLERLSPHFLLVLEFLYYIVLWLCFVPVSITGMYWGMIFLVFLCETMKFTWGYCSRTDDEQEEDLEGGGFLAFSRRRRGQAGHGRRNLPSKTYW